MITEPVPHPDGGLILPPPHPKHGATPAGARREIQICDLLDLRWERDQHGPDGYLGKLMCEEKGRSLPNTSWGSATDLTLDMLFRFRRSLWLLPTFSSTGSDHLVTLHVGIPSALEYYFHEWEKKIYKLTYKLNSARDSYKYALMTLEGYTESAAEEEAKKMAEDLKRATKLHYPSIAKGHVEREFQEIDLSVGRAPIPYQIRDFVTANPFKPKRAKRKSGLELSQFDIDKVRPRESRNRNGHKNLRDDNCPIFNRFFGDPLPKLL